MTLDWARISSAVGCCPLALLLSIATASAAEPVKASFLDGVWATEDGCIKQAALDAGADRNVESVPETLTADGYHMWEGSCTFASVAGNGERKWTVKTSCGQEAEEWEDTESWVMDPGGARLEVTLEDKKTEFVRCEAGKGQ